MTNKILYILPFRAKNQYRRKNLKLVLQWITQVKDYLSKTHQVTMDICVVEQDREASGQIAKDQVMNVFLHNNVMFNKGWSFNVVVKQFPTYQYYVFADADLIIPNVDEFAERLVEYCFLEPKHVFRPFLNRLDTTLTQMEVINTFSDLNGSYAKIHGNLQKHDGLSFASSMIVMDKETYDRIGGWEESFKGWGRYDDFVTHKLAMVCQQNGLYATCEAVHLWHPITLDFSLNQDNVVLYDKYVKFSQIELLQQIETNAKTMGNPDLYKNR